MNDHPDPEDRQQEVRSAIAKIVGVALAIGIGIGVVTWVVVGSLDLNADSGPVGSTGVYPTVAPLPTAALTESGGPSPSPTDGLTEFPSDLPTLNITPGDDGLTLDLSPAVVGPMERINLTGEWPGQDNVSLLVQRFEDGEWVDFGVQVQVRVGSFATYVLTGREGENRFRVYDPASGSASNEASVTVE